MRLADSLVGQEGTRLIDFDVCGHGWFLYDFAASISLIEKRSVYRDIQSRVGPGVSVGSGLKCRGRGRDRDSSCSEEWHYWRGLAVTSKPLNRSKWLLKHRAFNLIHSLLHKSSSSILVV